MSKPLPLPTWIRYEGGQVSIFSPVGEDVLTCFTCNHCGRVVIVDDSANSDNGDGSRRAYRCATENGCNKPICLPCAWMQTTTRKCYPHKFRIEDSELGIDANGW